MSNSNHTRGFLPLGESRKRDLGLKTGSDGFKRPPKLIRPSSSPNPNPNPNPKSASNHKAEVKVKPDCSKKAGCKNRILAGYMASEFLNKGTILGQKYDPARSEASPVSGKGGKKEAIGMSESYAEVANLLKGDGSHLPGIVNPTQLARWLQM